MRSIAIIVLLLVAFPAIAADDLVLEISAPKEISPDEQLDVKAVFRNTGKADRYVVRDIDGSFFGLRSVVDYKWIVKQNGKPMSRRTDIVRIDNHVNALQAADVLLVKAGKEIDPFTLGFGRLETFHDLTTPGKYTIALQYEMNPGGIEKGDPDVQKNVIAKQKAVLLESKPIEVTVRPFPAAVLVAADKVKLAEAKRQIVQQFADTVAKNPNSTAQERDAANERLKRADAAHADAAAEHAKKYAEFAQQRAEERKKK